MGASAGALIAVLSACGVDLERSAELAHELVVRKNVFARPQGLAGVWGPMVREWLDTLLPADAAERCRGRVYVVMLRARNPWFPFTFDRLKVADYASREELIDAVMASVHLPLFFDGSVFARFRG